MKKLIISHIVAIGLISSASAQTLIYSFTRQLLHPNQTRGTQNDTGYVIIESPKKIVTEYGKINKCSYAELYIGGNKTFYPPYKIYSDASNGLVVSIVKLGSNLLYLAQDTDKQDFNGEALSGTPSLVNIKSYGSAFIAPILTESWSVWYPYGQNERRFFGDITATRTNPITVSLSVSNRKLTFETNLTTNVVKMDLDTASDWLSKYLKSKGYHSSY